MSRLTKVALGSLVAAVVLLIGLFVAFPPPEPTESGGTVPQVEATVVPPEEWASVVCPALADYAREVIGAEGEFPTSAETEAERAEAKELFTQLFLDGSELSDATARDVAAQGAPDVPTGRTLSENLRRALLRAQDDMAQGRRDLDAVPTDDEAAFRTGLIAAATTLQGALQPYGEAVAAIASDPDLGPIVAGQEGCAPT